MSERTSPTALEVGGRREFSTGRLSWEYKWLGHPNGVVYFLDENDNY
jgi:hypothetical protein